MNKIAILNGFDEIDTNPETASTLIHLVLTLPVEPSTDYQNAERE